MRKKAMKNPDISRSSKTKFQVGDWVRVVADRRVTGADRRACIQRFDVDGAVLLDRRVLNFQWWNVLDLAPARPPAEVMMTARRIALHRSEAVGKTAIEVWRSLTKATQNACIRDASR